MDRIGSGDNPLIRIIAELATRGVAFIVAGGVAAILHGVRRLTLDLDIALDMRERNVRRFLEAMREMGLKPRAPVRPEVLLDPEAVAAIVREKNALVFSFIDPDRPYRQIDVFITARHAYGKLIRDVEELEIEGRRVAVLTKRALIEEKLALDELREQDLIDIEALQELMRSGDRSLDLQGEILAVREVEDIDR